MTKQIVLNFTSPPSNEDIQAIAESYLDGLPQELDDICDGLEIAVDHFPEEAIQQELELETDFDLLALYIDAPDKTLMLYRRPILDVWCETEDDLGGLIRHLMITELAQGLDYSAEEIERLANQPYDG